MANPRTEPPYNAGIDANQYPTTTAVSGTAGTSDTSGTSEVVRLGANPTTGALYVESTTAAAGTTNIQGSVIVTGGTIQAGTFTNLGTNVNVVTGTQQTLGTVGTVPGIGTITNVGSVTDVARLYSGTINVGTFVIPSGTVTTIVAGTQNTLGTVGTVIGVGTLTHVGSVSTIGTVNTIIPGTPAAGIAKAASGQGLAAGNVVVPSGQVVIVGGFPDLTTEDGNWHYGYISDAGESPVFFQRGTVTSVSNLVKGTVLALASGTITGGTLQNLVSGTINALASGTITAGTVIVGTVTTGTVERVQTVGNIQSGTITEVIGDHLAPYPVNTNAIINSYGTLGTTGAEVWGTLVAAAGAGTRQWVNALSIVVSSGTVDCAIAGGTVAGPNGTNIFARGRFVPGGGVAETFTYPLSTGTNGTLVYWMGGAGTAYFIVNYVSANVGG